MGVGPGAGVEDPQTDCNGRSKGRGFTSVVAPRGPARRLLLTGRMATRRAASGRAILAVLAHLGSAACRGHVLVPSGPEVVAGPTDEAEAPPTAAPPASSSPSPGDAAAAGPASVDARRALFSAL